MEGESGETSGCGGSEVVAGEESQGTTMNSVLRNKLDSRNARLWQAVDPDHLIEEAELKVQAREHEVTSARAPR